MMKEYKIDLAGQGPPLKFSPVYTLGGYQKYSSFNYESGIPKFDTFLEGKKLAETILDFFILVYEDFIAFAILDDMVVKLSYCVKKDDVLNIVPHYKQIIEESTKSSLSNKLGVLAAAGGIVGGIVAITIDSIAKSKPQNGFYTKTRKVKGCIHEIIIRGEDSEPSKIFLSTRESSTNYVHNFFQEVFKISLHKTNPNYGCYIATICYGDVDAAEVIRFKRYRDEVLSNNFLGRSFIRLYYLISPKISNWLYKKHTLNHLIRRFILDIIYNKLKKD